MIESIVQCLNKVHIAHILICIQNLAYIHILILQPRNPQRNQFSMFDAFSGVDSKNAVIYQRKIKTILINSFIRYYFCSQCWFQRGIIRRDMYFQVFCALERSLIHISRYFSYKTRNTGCPKYEIFNTRLYRNRFDPGLIMVYEGSSLIVSYVNFYSISSEFINIEYIIY